MATSWYTGLCTWYLTKVRLCRHSVVDSVLVYQTSKGIKKYFFGISPQQVSSKNSENKQNCLESFLKNLTFGVNFKLLILPLMCQNEHTQHKWYEKLVRNLDWNIIMIYYVCIYVCKMENLPCRKIIHWGQHLGPLLYHNQYLKRRSNVPFRKPTRFPNKSWYCNNFNFQFKLKSSLKYLKMWVVRNH